MKKYPFKFLDAYGKQDADFFFGRDEEINALYEMVFQSPILLVYGASGTGKTSLIQCGLAGKFEAHDWLPLLVRRGLDINVNLKKALADAGGVVEQAVETPSWLDKFRSQSSAPAGRALNYFDKALKAVYLHSFKPVYLIFDQFEELFILGSKEEQDGFIESVRQIIQVEQPVKMIFSIREEYLGCLSDFEKAVPQLFRKKLRVEPMNRDKVRQVIEGATEHKNSNVTLKDGEAEQIADGIFKKIKGDGKGLTIPLPYLQVFLDKFYLDVTGDESRQKEAVFSLDALNKIGDIGDILQNFLEEQVAGISKKLSGGDPTLTIPAIWSILSPFATLEGTKEPIDKRDLYAKLPNLSQQSIDAVIEAFINGRILKYNEDLGLYELAHDALAKRVAEKRSDEEIALLEIKRLIKTQTALKADARELFSERQLNFIEPFLSKIKLADDEKALIAESWRTIIKNKKARKRKFEWFVALILVALASVSVLAIWAIGQKAKTDAAKDQAQTNLDKANRLINSFYFYDGIALVYKGGYYGYINKKGDFVLNFLFAQAGQFEEPGFAKVKMDEHVGKLTDYLIDTSGRQYRVAYKINDLQRRVTKALDLRNQEISPNKFPPQITANPQLQILLLSIKDTIGSISKLPVGFDKMINLKVLELANIGLKELPASIGKLVQLQGLDLSGNTGLIKLPAAIGQLKQLKSLNLSHTGLTSLPDSIGELTQLQSLNLSGNPGLVSLSPAILKLKQLKNLNLSYTGLTALPDSIGQLINLQRLDLGGDQRISSIPSSIGRLRQLKNLKLAETGLTALPPAIGQLTQLLRLDISHDQLIEIPRSIAKLKLLRSLDLSADQAARKPTTIALLTGLDSLTNLNLSGIGLTELPSSIGQLIHLDTLELYSNNLTRLPDSFGQLTKLKRLSLSSSKLSELPESFANLTNLAVLALDRNQFTQLPDWIGNLKSIQIFNLARNQLKQLPSSIGDLPDLFWLNLRLNKLKALPPSLSQPKNLKFVYISGNQLTPAARNSLKNLSVYE